jgi:hypothetical protein
MVHGVLADLSWPCPPFCSDPNLLNSPVEHGTWSRERTEAVAVTR